jgi:gliding motility-associated-like protein
LGSDKRDTICFADTYNLNTLFNTNGLTANWTLNGTPVANVNAVSSTGTYQLEAINSNGCADSALFFFTKLPPVIAFGGHDTIAMSGTPHQLFATGGVNYSWTPVFALDNASIQNPMATLNADQQFIVTVTNEIGCAGFDTVFLKVYDNGPTYLVPNAFTPDGDGLNDIFRPIPVGIVKTDWFKIFNRYGQLIYSNNKYLYGWNGTINGIKQPTGTYVWIVSGYDQSGNAIVKKGTVILIR